MRVLVAWLRREEVFFNFNPYPNFKYFTNCLWLLRETARARLRSWFPAERLKLVLLLAAPGLVACLAACGGGGGGGGDADMGNVQVGSGSTAIKNIPSSQPSASPAPSVTQDEAYWATHDEFRRSAGLAVINASGAYAQGATGAGVTIGFVDTGILTTHDEFDGQGAAGQKVAYYNATAIAGSASDKQLSHGTAVASLAAGRHGAGDRMQGVAFDAKVAMWAVLEQDDGSLAVDGAILSNAFNGLADSGARIINNSWAVSTHYDPLAQADHKHAMEALFGSSLDIMARGQAAFVTVTGNAGETEPVISGTLPLFFPEISGKFIAVTSVGLDGVIDSRANHCGVAAAFCVAAPGGYSDGQGYVVAASSTGGYRTVRGTSFAAAYASGVLALMRQVFGDQMTVEQYVERLLATAKKDGIYADSSIYGQGLIDAMAAVTPVGRLAVPQADGGSFEIGAFSSDASRADGLFSGALAQEKFVALDALGDPFPMTLGSLVNSAHHTPLASLFDADNDTLSEDVLASHLPRFYGHKHSRMAKDVLGGARFETSLRGRGDQVALISGFNFYPEMAGASKLSAGVVIHKNGLLALSDAALFSGAGVGETVYVDFKSKHELSDDWVTILNLNLSRSGYRPESGLVSDIAVDLASDMSATFVNGNTHIRLRRSSMVDRGHASFTLPVRRNTDGSIQFERRDLALNDQGLWQVRLTQYLLAGTRVFVDAQKDQAREQIAFGLAKSF
jgi:subtilisin family serine protease